MNAALSSFCVSAPLLVLMTLSGGCGGTERPDGLPDLVPYSVKVTYKGANVDGANVLFSPTSGEYSAAGTTDQEGVAVMKTDGQYAGVPVGEYRVSVTKIDSKSDASLPGSQGSPTNPGAYGAAFEASQKKAPSGPKYLLPEKYSSFDKSELKVSVSEGGSGQEAIVLAD